MCTHTRMFTLTPCFCGLCLYESDPSIPINPSDVSRASVCWASCPTASWKTMDFDVFWQVVTAGKLLLTYRTLVGFDPRVGPPVPRKLIRPWKPGRKKKRCLIFDKQTESKSRGHELRIWWSYTQQDKIEKQVQFDFDFNIDGPLLHFDFILLTLSNSKIPKIKKECIK